MPSVKANFRNVDSRLKEEFKRSKCLLTISVGQESHEGALFKATVELLNSAFKECIITLHDTLQRFTMALDKSEPPSFFRETAAKEGLLWLSRNKGSLAHLSIPYKVISWDDWVNSKNFEYWREKVGMAVNTDATYRSFFDETIDGFLVRYRKRLNDDQHFDLIRARVICMDYLIEECAVLCLWAETKGAFELYPGTHNVAMLETRRRFVHSLHPNLVRAIRIGFNKRSNMQPQQFTTLKRGDSIKVT